MEINCPLSITTTYINTHNLINFPFNQVPNFPSQTLRLKKRLQMSHPNYTQIQPNSGLVRISWKILAYKVVSMHNHDKTQKIVIPNSRGEKLVGTLHETGSDKIVILCHGFKSTKDHNTISKLAGALEKDGNTVFCFDFSGNGESEGTFEYANYWREAEDLRAVIEHFKNENRLISTILGHSKGGNVVLLYASKYHDIPAVVNVSGRYNLKGGIVERMGKDFFEQIKKDGFFDVKNMEGEFDYRVTEESLKDRLNTNMHEACLHIDKNCRVLTVHGSKDTIIPVEDAIEFSKIIPNHELLIIEDANHGYTSHQAELASVILPFINKVSG